MAIDLDALLKKGNASAEATKPEVTNEETSEESAAPPTDETKEEEVSEEAAINKGADEEIETKEDDKGEEVTDDDSEKDKPTETETKPKETPETEEAEVDLTEIHLEVDGKDRSVSELLEERDQMAAALDWINKDEFLSNLIQHYKATGTVDAYLEAKGRNWDKVSDIDILKMKFDQEYADLKPEIREKMFKREIANKYMVKADLTEFEKDSEDYLIAQGMLERDATKARAALKDEQKKFQTPQTKKEEAKPQEKYNPETFKKELLKVKEVDAFAKSNLLPLGVKGEDGQQYGFEADSKQIIEMMADDRKFWQTLTKDGKVDHVKQAKVYAFAQNPDYYEQELIKLGKSLGQEDRLKDKKNVDGRLNKKTTQTATPSVGDAGWKEAFLKEALRQKGK